LPQIGSRRLDLIELAPPQTASGIKHRDRLVFSRRQFRPNQPAYAAARTGQSGVWP